MKLHKQYGSIVREEYIKGQPYIHLYDVKDVETVLRNEGRVPHRILIEGMKAYREDRNITPGLGGL
jgi:hypothetical protein